MTHKFGIKVPKTVEEALALDKENGNDLWWKVIQKEMSAVKVAFKILDDDDKPRIGSQYMKCHMVFSIKMEDFSRKMHLVAGGHMVEAPKSLTFASVVSRESVKIALTLAALNDLEVKTSDIKNAYLTAPCSEKVHTTLGTEFGENKGKRQQSLSEHYMAWHHQEQVSETILQIACTILATSLVWQILTSGTSLK